MQYTCKIHIKKPLSEVIKKFDSIENLKHWQTGLISTEHISGIPNALGGKMKLNYSFGNRKLEVTEVITKKDLPTELHVTYAAKDIRNIQENHFKALDDHTTEWVSKNELQPTSLKMSVLLFLMPNTFKKQTKLSMTNFKNFVEKGISVLKTQ